MNRRYFTKNALMAGAMIPAISNSSDLLAGEIQYAPEDVKGLPSRDFDVVVAGGGTAGVVAAIASARQGAKTALIEAKGYVGGTVTEGGTALHSFFNLWTAFPGVKKRQVVKGIAQEIIDRLLLTGGTTGHGTVTGRTNYDSVCTAIDTELYKLAALEMLTEAGVHIFTSTLVAGAVRKKAFIEGVITQSRTYYPAEPVQNT